MSRERIISGLVAFLVIASFGGVYQFYFREKLATYVRDENFKTSLDTLYNSLRNDFQETRPEDLISAWNSAVQPWNEAIIDRGRYFTFSNWLDHEKPSKEEPILRFWYDRQVQAMLTKLYSDLAQAPGLTYYPQYNEVINMFRIPTLEDWKGVEVTEREINTELSQLAFGINAMKLLATNRATAIESVTLWPVRQVKEQEGLLRLRTTGMKFRMNMRDFTRFIDNTLRTGDRYFTIDGIKIIYPYIAYNIEPQLQVEMLLTQATFVESALNSEGGARTINPANANPADVTSGLNLNRKAGAGQIPIEEDGAITRAWKWFKLNVLFMK